MAQALEKIFLQKVAQMPQEEVELLPPVPKGKARKAASGTHNAGQAWVTQGHGVGEDVVLGLYAWETIGSQKEPNVHVLAKTSKPLLRVL